MASIYERLVSKYGDDALRMINKLKSGAPDLEDVRYPKNITQDVLAEKPSFKMIGQPTTTDFSMIPEGSALPAIRQNTIPAIIPEVLPAADDIGSALVRNVDDVGGALTRTADDIITTPKSNTLRNLALGTAALGGGAMMLSGGNGENVQATPVSKSIVKEPVKPTQEVAKSTITGKKSVVDNAKDSADQIIDAASAEKPTGNDDLERARQQDASNELLFGLLKAAQTGGSALAGSKADTSFADTELGKSDQAVNRLKADVEFKEAAEKRDPNSRISKLMQQSILALKPNANVAGLSAAQVEKIFPSLAQAINMQESITSRKEQAALQRELLANNKEDKKEQKSNEVANKHIDTYTKMLYKDYQGVQQAETNAKRAEDIVAQNIAGVTPGAGDIAILYNFIKGLDKNSAVREGEIGLSKQARSVLGRLDSEVKRLSGGDILDEDTRKAFTELISASAKAERLNFVKQKRNAIAAGAQKGIDPETLDKAIFADVSTKSDVVPATQEKKTVSLPSAQSPGSTINQKSTGKRFKVNADGITATEI